MVMQTLPISETERRILESYQKGFPLSPRPFLDVANAVGVTEDEVIRTLKHLTDYAVVSRVGPVFRPHGVGVSTLAAMRVPADRLAQVADLVSAYEEVNHNYEREHPINLWFVVTAPDADAMARVLDDIESRTGLDVLDLPLVQAYHIDLGFALAWN